MIKIRKNVFETNSSSSHSLVVCDNKTWNEFKEGRLFYNTLHESNGLPEFCTLKDIKFYIRLLYNDINRIKFKDFSEEEDVKRKVYSAINDLLFFQETFYSIDELEGYEYNEEKQEADLDYYFG